MESGGSDDQVADLHILHLQSTAEPSLSLGSNQIWKLSILPYKCVGAVVANVVNAICKI